MPKHLPLGVALLLALFLGACSSSDTNPVGPDPDTTTVIFDVRDGVWLSTESTRIVSPVQSSLCEDLVAEFATTPWSPIDTTVTDSYEESVCEITEQDLALGLFQTLGCAPVLTDSTYSLDCTTTVNTLGCQVGLRITVNVSGTDTTSTIYTRLEISGVSGAACGGTGLLCMQETTVTSRWVRAGACPEEARPVVPAARALRALGQE